jgi:endonuclease YncB( thermonuclease family)
MKTSIRTAVVAAILLVTPVLASAGDMLKVVKVVDANVVVVKKGKDELTIRLLGVVVPDPTDKKKEVADFGTWAAEYLTAYLKDQWVMVETEPKAPKTDKEGRLYGYVYRVKDASLVNEALIAEGYGIVPEQPEFPLSDRFLSKEQEARDGRRGIWGKEAYRAAEFGGGKEQPRYLNKVVSRRTYGGYGRGYSRSSGYSSYPGYSDYSDYSGTWVYYWVVAYR